MVIENSWKVWAFGSADFYSSFVLNIILKITFHMLCRHANRKCLILVHVKDKKRKNCLKYHKKL